MNILLTGGAGFIGSHLVAAYLKAGHQVTVLDDLSTGRAEKLPREVKIYQGSVTDLDFCKQVLREVKPEVINHHAAQILVVDSVRNPLKDANINILGMIALLTAALEAPGLKRIIYATSGGAMYGPAKELPCSEEAPALPASPYGLSKNTAERYLWLLSSQTNLSAVVLRYSNVYGPGQDPHGEAGVCAIFAERMLSDHPVTIFGDGSQFRDYIYVDDVAAANLLALEKGAGEAFNIAAGVGTTTQEVFDLLKAEIGYRKEAQYQPERPGDIPGIYLSNRKAKAGLGWQARYTFAEGIKETVAWYRQDKKKA